MAPKKAELAVKRAEAAQDLSPSALDFVLPLWGDVVQDSSVQGYEDPLGTAMLSDLEQVVTVWKRPAEFLPSVSDIPMHMANPLSAADNTSFAGKLFSGHSSLRWLCACFNSIQELRSKMPAKGQLWELIHPQDSKGQPIKSESGRYYVKCFMMDDWRRVTVDDRIPVDVFGAPLLVGSMPSQLWPLILSKAVIKLMALCQVLHMSLWHQVAAFQWLTGWPQENLMDPIHGVSIAGSALYDRLHESCEQGGSGVAGRAMTMAHFRGQARDKLRRPSFLVLCSPSGLPVEDVIQQLVAQHLNSVGRIVTHSSRMPLQHEVQGDTYNFLLPDSMQADKEAGKFLEANTVDGFHGSAMFGIAFSAVSSMAATGRMGIVRVDMQGVLSLKGNSLVDAVYVYVAPASMEAWAQQQSLRLTESEATLQHQLAWAQQQIAGAAAPGLFDVTVQDDSPKAAYVGLQEAVAPLSPAVRHKLQGLPADLLDYADLIASSSVEQPILKPVLVAGPSSMSKAQLVHQLVQDFPKAFQLVTIHSTPAYGQAAHDDASAGGDSIVSSAEFQRLQQSGELVEQHSDPLTNVLARQQHGVTKASVDAAVAEGKIPLLLTDVEGAQAARATGLDCWCIFLAPASPQAFETEVRQQLKRPQADVDAQIAAAQTDWDFAQSSDTFDHKLVLNSMDQACEELTEMLTRYRPDLMSSSDRADSSSPNDGSTPQPPLVICCVAGNSRDTLIGRLMQDYPSKFGYAIRHTSKKPEKGEVEGVHFFFVKKEVMQKMADGGQLVEWSEGQGGSLTGTAATSLQQVAGEGKMCILSLDVRRALALAVPNALKVYVAPGAGLAQAVKAGLPPGTKEPQVQQAIQAATAEADKAKDAAESFAATVSEGPADTMYIALKQAIAGHSPTVVPPASKPLVLAGPFGAACRKGELLRWLLREYGDKLALPEMVTTKARGNAVEAGPTFKVVTPEEAEAMQAQGQLLLSEQACGHMYGITKAAVQAVQCQNKVCVVDLDRAADVQSLREQGFEACYVGLAPEGSQTMLDNIETALAHKPLPGYEPEDAACLLLQAAEAEVTALQQEGLVEVCVAVGGSGEPALRQAFYRLLEQISLHYPQAIPMSQVWGYGRPSWDLASRQYGQKPFRVVVLGPPLSGKTSQCQALSGSLGLPLIQVGPLLQARAAAGDDLLQEILQGDGLVPDSKYVEAIDQRLQQQDCTEAGWLLDGFPHTLAQAEALQAAGHVPDKVIMLEAPQLVLADRAKYRRIDPLTHRIFHLAPGSGALLGAVTPTLPDGSPDEAATSRLIPRGDDFVLNVQHRLAAWTKHARLLGKKYADSSSRVSAVGDIGKVMGGVKEAVLAQDRLSQDICPVSCSSLISHHCQIVSVAKWRGMQIAQLVQGTGSRAWVELTDLVASSHSITVAQDPDAFRQAGQMKRADLRVPPHTPALFVNCKDPVHFMVSFSGGPRFSSSSSSNPTPPVRQASGFQLVIEPFEWGKGGAGGRAPLLQLHTPTAAAARLSLPPGRHLARLLTNPHNLYALDLRCNVPFQLDSLDKLLQDEEGLAVQKCEGRVGPLPPYTWALWFRYSFKLSQPCTLDLDLQMPGEALLKAASLVLLDLDTSQETHFLIHRTQPLLLPVNKEGYSVLAHSECPEEVPSLAWRLNLISQQPLQGWSQLPSTRQDLFEGMYEANQHLILGRYVLSPSQRTLLTLHAQVTSRDGRNDLACQVSISPIAGAAAQWGKDAESLWEWPGADQVTIAGQWLPAGKYLLQLALDPASSQCEVGQHGSIPFDVFWKLQLLPTADAKVCPIVPDDSKQKFSQAAFAKWNEGQKERPKQVNAAVEAHKARVSAASAAAEQHRENITLKPVPKGKKEEPLELHPEAFVRIKAQKITEEPSATVTVDMSSLVEIKAAPALDVEGWKQARAANRTMLEAANQAMVADFVSWRQQQLRQLQLAEDQ